jgi:hypothetical protein
MINTIGLALNLVRSLIKKQLERYGEAAEYFQQAAEIQQTDSPLNSIVCLEDAVECHVYLRDYKASCANLIWIIKLAGEALTSQNECKLKKRERERESKPNDTITSFTHFFLSKLEIFSS